MQIEFRRYDKRTLGYVLKNMSQDYSIYSYSRKQPIVIVIVVVLNALEVAFITTYLCVVPRPRFVSINTPFAEDWTQVVEKKRDIISGKKIQTYITLHVISFRAVFASVSLNQYQNDYSGQSQHTQTILDQ